MKCHWFFKHFYTRSNFSLGLKSWILTEGKLSEKVISYHNIQAEQLEIFLRKAFVFKEISTAWSAHVRKLKSKAFLYTTFHSSKNTTRAYRGSRIRGSHECLARVRTPGSRAHHPGCTPCACDRRRPVQQQKESCFVNRGKGSETWRLEKTERAQLDT